MGKLAGNFDFLQDEYPALARFGNQADTYRESDANASLIKLGMLGESIVDMIWAYAGMDDSGDVNTCGRINRLGRDGYIPEQVVGVLHEIRKSRNRAVHDGWGSVSRAKLLTQVAHSVCLWFAMAYGKKSYERLPYVEPGIASSAPTQTNTQKTSDAEDRRAAAEAAEKAKAEPKVPRAERARRVAEAENQRPKSEAETRLLIDAAMRDAGWEADTENIRYSKGVRPARGRNLAIAEWPTDSAVSKSGRVDYAFFVGERMVATIEAKAEHKDVASVLDVQCKEYSSHIRAEDMRYVVTEYDSGRYQVPFTFATNGRPYLKQYAEKSGIWELDLRDPSNPPRALMGWPSPDGIMRALSEDVAAADRRLEETPYDLLRDEDGLNLRDYQIRAVEAVERAITSGRRTTLVAMATGTGKTRAALGMIYRLLSSGRFYRILFLVDRDSLGEQAEDAFKNVKLDQLLSLEEIYDVKGLDDSGIDPETRVSVATVQSMIKRIMYSEVEGDRPAVTDFDLVIVDEAHRGYVLDREMTDEESLYRDQRDYQSKYRAVIDYFDAVKVALTATPALHTTQIFGAPVFQYTYREAVIDGYLVDHDAPHALRTKLSEEGIHYRPGDTATVYDPVTGELLNGAEIADELDFNVDDFNRKVVDENFDRAVLTEVAADFDPESPDEQGKMLIYAVDDAHADMIVRILKETWSETGVDNDAVMKITAAAGGGNPKRVRELIRRFKNERYPSVAVTVDLLTTGIDVPAITTLVFMRRVRSRILFEQMLGRATRLCPEIHKTHFEIYDPVGVYDALEDVTAMKPVSANPATTVDQLVEGLEHVEGDDRVQAQLDRLVARLRRKARALGADGLVRFEREAGFTLAGLADELRSGDPQAGRARALELRERLAALDVVRANGSHAVIISDRPDELVSHTRDYGGGVRPADYLDAFSAYVRTNVNEVTALNVCVTRPADLTRESLRELELALSQAGFTETRLNRAVSEMTNAEMAADIISLVRRYAIGSELLSHEERIHRAVDRLRAAHDFTGQELGWLKRIETYLVNDSVLNARVFDEDERFRSKGGFKKLDKVFRGGLTGLVRELNGYLYDDRGNVA